MKELKGETLHDHGHTGDGTGGLLVMPTGIMTRLSKSCIPQNTHLISHAVIVTITAPNS